MKTELLTGRALDYAVALAEGHKLCNWWGRGSTQFEGLQFMLPNGGYYTYVFDSDANRHTVSMCEDSPYLEGHKWWSPTTRVEGDNIIDREKIGTLYVYDGMPESVWTAYHDIPENVGSMASGATRREAAMRCYVLVKLGKNVDIPKGMR